MKNIIKEIIQENQENGIPRFVKRDIDINTELPVIVSLIGARRSGKTYILYQLIHDLLTKGIDSSSILFLNFEDERLSLNSTNLDLIIQAYQELYPGIDLHNCYFFFDEIQNITGWEKFIRRMYDTKTRHIFLTGSNAKLLSTEIATELRGRTISYTVYPLNFNEYLRFNNVPYSITTQANRSILISHAYKYMQFGGFPELLFVDDTIRVKILQQYFNTMIFRDIVERYKITNPEILKYFIKKLLAGVTKPFSINKTYNDLRSQGYSISNNYLYEYFNYCNNVFITQSLSRFNYSELKQEKSDKKAYIIDNGLLSSIEFTISKNNGKLFENMVVMELLKSGKQLFYYKNTHECDIVITNKDKQYPLQITYEMHDDSTRQREIKGLIAARKFLNTNEGCIITFDHEEEFVFNGMDIKCIPFYKFFYPTTF